MPPAGAGDAGAGSGPAAEQDEAWLEAGRWLFAQPCRFVGGVKSETQLPTADLPEIAFAGRSNVGKSSLINALTSRRVLARTSNTPGRTREINYFELAERLYLVDLPGYGYARAPKSEVKQWTRLIHDYLRGRHRLRRAILLVDARHGLKPADETVMAAMDQAAVSYQVVLTKLDKLRREESEARLQATRQALARRPAAHPTVLGSSATTGAGIAALRAEIAALVAAG